MRAVLMFNGHLTEGEVLRETEKRLLVHYESSTGRVRDVWVTKVTRPEGQLVSQRVMGKAEERLRLKGVPVPAEWVTIPGNTGFAL